MKFYNIIYLGLLFLNLSAFAQEKTANNKSKVFFYWGYNRSSYADSDITFSGSDYEFTLTQVKAKDRQTPWNPSIYLNPILLTIPQYNFKIGYFINDHISISIGTDHMKYVMIQNQSSVINGTISEQMSSKYEGSYDNQPIEIKEDLLTFEHTDGLNYVHPEIDYAFRAFNWKENTIMLEGVGGVGAGILYPKTNTALMNRNRYDHFNIAGYGVSAKIGAKLTLLKYFFLQLGGKVGYINMPNIRVSQNKADRAKQHFTFKEAYVVFGFQVALDKLKK